MGYFDSPKNRAFWNRELAGLKEERELRKKGLSGPERERSARQEDAYHGPRRELVTFKQLMAEEQAVKKSRLESKKGVSRSWESALNQHVREPSPEMQMKTKTGRQLGGGYKHELEAD